MKQKLISRLLWVALALVFLAGSAYKVINIYTTEKTKELATEMAAESYPWYGNGTPTPFFLGRMLRNNIYIQNKEVRSYAGDETPETYSKGWRTLAAQNPKLVQAAISQYGPCFVRQFGVELIRQNKIQRQPDAKWRKRGNYIGSLHPDSLKNDLRSGYFPRDWTVDSLRLHRKKEWTDWKNDSTTFEENLRHFSLDEFWKQQRQILLNYKNLMDELAALPDSTLNKFITQIGEEQSQFGGGDAATELHQWLFEKHLVSQMPQPHPAYQWYNPWAKWHWGQYPVDALFLTYRIRRDYHEWTARRFIWEAQKAIKKVDAIIPKSK